MKRGRRYLIYGAFATKADAKTCERAGKGRFIVKRTIKRQARFVVLKPRG